MAGFGLQIEDSGMVYRITPHPALSVFKRKIMLPMSYSNV
jgi:hypothetical protein